MILPETILHDVRHGVRMLARNPGSTFVTVLALGLGIAVNTAVFTAYKASVLRPLDAHPAAGMVNIALSRASGATQSLFSYPDYQTYRDSLRSFSGLIAYRPAHFTLSNAGPMISQRTSAAGSALGRLALLGSGVSNAEFASVFIVSENYFMVLGVKPLQGRSFESINIPETSASRPVLISENYWQRRFAGDPAILGKTIYLNGVAVRIIGVTPRGFVGTGITAPAFWLPVSLEPLIHDAPGWLRDRENQQYRLFGRLAPDASIGQVQAEMGAIADRLRRLHNPRSESAKTATALVWPGSPFPLPLTRYRGLTLAILLIMAAAWTVLAVACANVGSLQLARARSRENELRTRMALGATRIRVIRQLITEGALLGLLAGVLALLLSWQFLKISALVIANALPVEYGTLVFDITPDPAIFAFVFAVSLAAGMISGLIPAIESSRPALSSAIRGSTSSFRNRRLQDVLIAAQVALCLVLMIAGSMEIRSCIRSLTMETGYESKHIFSLDLRFPETSRYADSRKFFLVQELRTRLAALPGVAAVTSARPPRDSRFRTIATLPKGETSSARSVDSILQYGYVQSDYFQTLGIPLTLGRSFQSQSGQTEYSVIVSESAAKQLWPGQNPVGRRIHLGQIDERFHNQGELSATGTAYEVIGVARDIRGAELDGSDCRRVYLPLPAARIQNYPILVRTRSDPKQIMSEVDNLVPSIDPSMMATISTLEEMLRQSPPFVISMLAAGVACTVGLLGLLLALTGIYGAIRYTVVLRTREVGIRMALGAEKRDIFELVLRESARPVLAGLIAGTLLAVGASQLARGLLYGIDGADGISIAGVSILFWFVALLASYLPARRAIRINPVVALRYE